MKFGVIVPQGWRLDLTEAPAGAGQYEAMKRYAQDAERLGYASFWLFDHFHTIPVARPESTFECWMSCAALAEATRTIRVGQIVTCNMFRPPSLLAKMSACLDVMSGGRLEFGLGAGWYEHEAIAYGYDFEKPAVRIGKMAEAIQIIRGMWSDDHFQFEGRYYHVGVGKTRTFHGEEVELDGVFNHPRPLQQPHPPIWLAGGGEQLTLHAVARYADWSNYWTAALDTIRHKNEVLDGHCEVVGRNPAEVHRSVGLEGIMGTFEQFAQRQMALGRKPEHVEKMRDSALCGSRQEIIDRIGTLAEQGRIEYLVVYFVDGASGDSLQKFAEEILPAFRS